MGLFGNQFSDVIEWNESQDDVIFWKWDNDEQNKQSDIFTKEEKYAIFEMIKKEFNLEND